MAATADYGSTFGALIFVQELTLLAYLVVRAARNDETEPDEESLQIRVGGTDTNANHERAPEADRTPPRIVVEGGLDEDTRFLFDVVARRNESIVQRVDALDNGLIAVTVGIIAAMLFAADKWFDLDPNFRFAGISFLLESAIFALSGYLTSSFVGERVEDVVRLSDFAVDFSESHAEATFRAIENITKSERTNVTVRRYKRAFIVTATLLLIVAVGIVTGSRAGLSLGPSQNE